MQGVRGAYPRQTRFRGTESNQGFQVKHIFEGIVPSKGELLVLDLPLGIMEKKISAARPSRRSLLDDGTDLFTMELESGSCNPAGSLGTHEKVGIFSTECSKSIEKTEIRTQCERTLDRISAAIAFTVSLDAGLFKVTDNALKEQVSIFSKIVRVGFKVLKWNLVPGSFIVDVGMMLAKEAGSSRKIKEMSPYKARVERDLRAKNREAAEDFWQAEGLSLINRFA